MYSQTRLINSSVYPVSLHQRHPINTIPSPWHSPDPARECELSWNFTEMVRLPGCWIRQGILAPVVFYGYVALFNIDIRCPAITHCP